jgi:hypothetical protein
MSVWVYTDAAMKAAFRTYFWFLLMASLLSISVIPLGTREGAFQIFFSFAVFVPFFCYVYNTHLRPALFWIVLIGASFIWEIYGYVNIYTSLTQCLISLVVYLPLYWGLVDYALLLSERRSVLIIQDAEENQL